MKIKEIRQQLIDDFGYSQKEANAIKGKTNLEKELERMENPIVTIDGLPPIDVNIDMPDVVKPQVSKQEPSLSDEIKAIIPTLVEQITQQVTQQMLNQPPGIAKPNNLAMDLPPQQPQNNNVVKLNNKSKSRVGTNDIVRGQSKQGNQCRTENIKIGDRPNLFESSDMFDKYQGDVAIDKKLHAGNQRVQKRQPALQYEVACEICGDVNVVSAELVYIDPDKNVHYKCNGCSGSN